jgi:hypothetical protein
MPPCAILYLTITSCHWHSSLVRAYSNTFRIVPLHWILTLESKLTIFAHVNGGPSDHVCHVVYPTDDNPANNDARDKDEKQNAESIFKELKVDTSETDKTVQVRNSNFRIPVSEYLRAEESY